MKRYRMKSEIRYIDTEAGKMKLVILRPRGIEGQLPGILWIHGGGLVGGGTSDPLYNGSNFVAANHQFKLPLCTTRGKFRQNS